MLRFHCIRRPSTTRNKSWKARPNSCLVCTDCPHLLYYKLWLCLWCYLKCKFNWIVLLFVLLDNKKKIKPLYIHRFCCKSWRLHILCFSMSMGCLVATRPLYNGRRFFSSHIRYILSIWLWITKMSYVSLGRKIKLKQLEKQDLVLEMVHYDPAGYLGIFFMDLNYSILAG